MKDKAILAALRSNLSLTNLWNLRTIEQCKGDEKEEYAGKAF